MQLNLKPNREFIQRLPSMKLFAAESRADGRLAYVEEEAAGSGSMGRPYHDDEAMAAVVVRHEKDGRILLVSCMRLCRRRRCCCALETRVKELELRCETSCEAEKR
jgi:hypothetical protein